MSDRLTLQEQALALTAEDRAAMASALLHSLNPPDHDVSDEELFERRRELESGEVAEITHEELLAKVKRPSAR